MSKLESMSLDGLKQRRNTSRLFDDLCSVSQLDMAPTLQLFHLMWVLKKIATIVLVPVFVLSSGCSKFRALVGNADLSEVNSTPAPTPIAPSGGSLVSNTVVASSSNPQLAGQPVVFIAAVAPSSFNSILPSGSVVFSIDGIAQPGVSVSNGTAKIVLSSGLSAGAHSIVASYSGDSNYAASKSPAMGEIINSTFSGPWVPSHSIDVTKYGVVGDGVTDVTAALQKLIHDSPDGSLFYFPAGTYLVSKTIDFSSLTLFGMLGDVTSGGDPASTIKSNVPGLTMISYVGDIRSLQVKNMAFAGPPGGIAFAKEANEDVFENCVFSGHIGLTEVYGFETSLRNVKFIGDGSAGSIGVLNSAGVIVDSYFTGWDEGVRLWGAGVGIMRSKFEYNKKGVSLGTYSDGSCWNYGGASLVDSTFVSNDIAVYAQCVVANFFSNLMIQGTSASPSGQSQYGFLGNWLQYSTITNVQFSGSFSQASANLNQQYTTVYGSPEFSSQGPVQDTQLTLPVSADDVTSSLYSGSVQPTMAASAMVYDVTVYGLHGDSTTDNRSALQNLINIVPQGVVIYFPQGGYYFSGMVDISSLKNVTFLGDTVEKDSRLGSYLFGTFAGPLINADYSPGAGTIHIRNLAIENDSSNWYGGIGILAKNLVLSSFEDVALKSGFVGARLVNSFALSLRGMRSNGGQDGLFLQLMNCMGCTVEGSDINGQWEAIMASGTGVSVYGSRFEVNYTGIDFGVDQNFNPAPLYNSLVLGNGDYESDAINVNLRNCINCSISAISSWAHYPTLSGTFTNQVRPSWDASGTINGGAWGESGIIVGASQNCSNYSDVVGGQFRKAGIVVSSDASNIIFGDSAATESCSASGVPDVPECSSGTPPPNWLIQNKTTSFVNDQYP